ncbi:hypothetical protein BKA69DRAFT_1076220 [Paraphysoderma sedebokerense]|nr:hypothetical protein BKA69DRAFT_1076220 [Paraphysoderma sedebokerense]
MKIMDDQPTTTSPPSSSTTEDSSTIYVENLPLHIATKPQSSSYISTIREFFQHKFGPVKSIYLPRPNEQLRAKLGNQRIKSYDKEDVFRGFCFVVFEEENSVGLVMEWVDKMNEISKKSEQNDEAGEVMGQEKPVSCSQISMDGEIVRDTDTNDDLSKKGTGITTAESSNYLLRNEHQLRLKIMPKTRWNQLEKEYVSWFLSQSELVKSYIDNQRSRRLAARTAEVSNPSSRDNYGKTAVGSTDFTTNEQEPESEKNNVMLVEETRQAKSETENSPKDYIPDVIVHFTNVHPEAKISVLNVSVHLTSRKVY